MPDKPQPTAKDPKPGDNAGKHPALDVTTAEFNTILDTLAGKMKAISEATGDLRNAIKTVLDQHGWHKGALGMIRSIDAMSKTKRADFLRTFDPMFELMYLSKWKDEAVDLIPDDSDDRTGKD